MKLQNADKRGRSAEGMEYEIWSMLEAWGLKLEAFEIA
jgi:hypothetical protein